MANLYRVRTAIAGNSGGRQVATHFFDAASPNTAQASADAVRSFWDVLKSKIVTTYTFTVEAVVDTIDVATGQPVSATGVTTTPVTGTEGTEKLPPATQGLIEWRTGAYHAGREIRGKTFIPGLSNSSSSAVGVPTSTWLALAGSATIGLMGELDAVPVVYSQKYRVFAPIIGGNGWSEWAVLRSRRD